MWDFKFSSDATRTLKFMTRYQYHMSPEFNQALSILLSSLNNSLDLQETISGDCVLQGSVQFIQNTFASKHIPSSGNWRWNQAKPRKTVYIPEGQVTFFKLTPRKYHPHDGPVPSYKLWKFCIKMKNGAVFYCLWCEKGPVESTSDIQEVTLQDFSFLAPFMSPNTAADLWPSSVPPG